jgi:HEPN domain-containing protein
VFNPAIAQVTQRLLDAAEALYLRAEQGIAALPRDCRPAIHAARLVYAEIGEQLLRSGLDSINQRTVVRPSRKLALLARARDDRYVVCQLGADQEAPAWVLGFHAQQAVEKALKAVLSGTGLEYPRTHNLVMLSELLRTAAIDLPPDVDDFGRLVPYGVVLRYGDATTDDPPPMESAWFQAVVTRTIDWASEYLNLRQD